MKFLVLYFLIGLLVGILVYCACKLGYVSESKLSTWNIIWLVFVFFVGWLIILIVIDVFAIIRLIKSKKEQSNISNIDILTEDSSSGEI